MKPFVTKNNVNMVLLEPQTPNKCLIIDFVELAGILSDRFMLRKVFNMSEAHVKSTVEQIGDNYLYKTSKCELIPSVKYGFRDGVFAIL
jgi:hypothetical protein